MNKFFILTIVVTSFATSVFAQSNLVDLNTLKTRFAKSFGINIADIKSAEVLTFGDRYFAYVKYIKDGKPHTTGQELALGGPGGFGGTGVTVTCTGVGCAECDIEGFPNPADLHCVCYRVVGDGGYCNMTKSITIGI
jgi:hypothetical protein